jgi:hypothetical protein
VQYEQRGNRALIRFTHAIRAPLITLIANLIVFIPTQHATAQEQISESGLTTMSDGHSVSALDVSVAIFDPGVPADASTHRDLQVYPKIRDIEALFLPFVLRETLLRTDEWGAVRVVPAPDIAAELLVSGTILHSDGEVLTLQIQATDSSGRIWINNTYTGLDTASNGRAAAMPGMSGYQELYDEVAEDLRVARTLLDNKTLGDITEISMLRYAENLVPSAFGGYLRNEPDGTYTIVRLPAESDPIFKRIGRIRDVEYVLTDAVDTKFKELHAEIAPTYDLWRKYRREYIQYQKDEAEHARTSNSSAPRGSYEAIKSSYDNFKWARLAEQEQANWAEGFDTEVGGTVDAVEARVAELEGWVDQHYAEWDRMLSEIFLLESSAE